MKWRWLAATGGLIAAALLALWLTRAFIAAEFARNYFRAHGVNATVEIGALGFSGASGRFALGPAAAPDLSAEKIELIFDPLRWTPYVTEVRLIRPVVRAQISADGQVTLGSLQDWLDSLRQQQGKSRYVSDDLVVTLTGLRAMLATPAGAVQADGDIKLVQNQPALVTLSLQPANLAWRGYAATITSGQLRYERESGRASLQLQGDLRAQGLDLKGLKADLKAVGLRWSAERGFAFSMPSASLTMTAARLNGAEAGNVKAGFTQVSFSASPLMAQAQMQVTGGLQTGTLVPSFHTGDTRLDRALAANLGHLKIEGAAGAAVEGGRTTVHFTAPLKITGTRGAVLLLENLQLVAGSDSLSTTGFRATLRGSGLPNAHADFTHLVWTGGSLTSHAAVSANFDYAMLRRAALRGQGTLSWQSGRYSFVPSSCAAIRLAAFHPGATDLARDIRADLCRRGAGPLLAGEGAHWRLSGLARRAQAFLPLANSQIGDATARLDFTGQGGDFHGQATVGDARLSDKTVPLRFKPLRASGTAALQARVWRGRFALENAKNRAALGDVTFIHAMATGKGAAHISAPKLAFAIDRLQPEDLSPLLAAFRRSEGAVDFQGDISWNRDKLSSHGTLAVNSLDFLTPLGRAHAVKTRLEFTSLLPPQTALGQGLTISRVDWTVPFSAVNLRFSFSPQAVRVDALGGNWAEGHVAITPFSINLSDPSKVAGTAELKSISLQALIAATNLSSKVRLEGKMSANIPFTTGPEGIRITKGRITADGPGRLSVNRSVWMQGDAAISSNAVQNFAYQALENLAFDSLTADLNSVANGRLQIVFHIKGKNDPPKPQTADVAIADILNGTALYKPIPLPSGTPVDLTLDASLNFDELLKSYAEAWSKTLSPAGATP